MPVHSHDPVCIFIYHDPAWIHTEGPDLVLELLCPVYDLALVELIRQVGEDHCRKLHPDADIHSVGFGRDRKSLTYLFHPLAPAPSHGHDTSPALIGLVPGDYPIAALCDLKIVHMAVKPEFHFIFQFFKQILQHHIVDIRSQMPH